MSLGLDSSTVDPDPLKMKLTHHVKYFEVSHKKFL